MLLFNHVIESNHIMIKIFTLFSSLILSNYVWWILQPFLIDRNMMMMLVSLPALCVKTSQLFRPLPSAEIAPSYCRSWGRTQIHQISTIFQNSVYVTSKIVIYCSNACWKGILYLICRRWSPIKEVGWKWRGIWSVF